MHQPETFLRHAAVSARTGIPRSSIYAWMAAGLFPKQVRLGARAVAWRSSDIDVWIASKATALPDGKPRNTAGEYVAVADIDAFIAARAASTGNAS